MKVRNNILVIVLCTLGFSLSSQVFARNSQEALQQRLNEEVLSKPFSVSDEATLSKSLNDATERGKPSKSEKKDNYYRYWYNGYYYPHPYSWYRYYGYW